MTPFAEQAVVDAQATAAAAAAAPAADDDAAAVSTDEHDQGHTQGQGGSEASLPMWMNLP